MEINGKAEENHIFLQQCLEPIAWHHHAVLAVVAAQGAANGFATNESMA